MEEENKNRNSKTTSTERAQRKEKKKPSKEVPTKSLAIYINILGEREENLEHSKKVEDLLQKLHSGMDTFTPNQSMSILVKSLISLGRSRINNLLTGLKEEGNESLQLQSVMDLCDFLSTCTEDNMSNVSVDSFVPPLLAMVEMDYNPMMMCTLIII
jgi:hypothetical protein